LRIKVIVEFVPQQKKTALLI